MIKHNL